MLPVEDRILYEDNHLIVVDKMCGELSQGDDTGDRTLADAVKAAERDDAELFELAPCSSCRF